MPRAWFACCFAVLGASPGCGGDPHTLAWRFEFESAADRDRAIGIGASVRRGGCDGDVVFATAIGAGSTPEATPALPAGTYGLVGRARDAGCTWFAEGCEVVELPLAESSVAIVLRATTARPICSPSECLDGRCQGELDAGIDGGILPDGGRDAGQRPDGCVSATEGCNGTDDDCDGLVDEDFNLLTDRSHCGACGMMCTGDTPCIGGECGDGPVEVGAGSNHSCVRYASGAVYCWGSNELGQLGDGTNTDRPMPVQVVGVDDAVSLTTGGFVTCVARRVGAVQCWGRSINGELGNGSFASSSRPVDVIGVSGAVQVAAGGFHVCARTSGGQVWCWGLGNHGQLGQGNTSSSAIALRVPGISTSTYIAGSYVNECTVLEDGRVQCWGDNQDGQVGDGTVGMDTLSPVTVQTLDDATQVALGWAHGCARRAGGTVSCWGQGTHGQLGTGMTGMALTPVDVVGLSDATDVHGGSYWNCARRERGSLECWGINSEGQLGTGDTGGRLVPGVSVVGLSDVVQASDNNSNHACAVRATGAVVCWGDGSHNQLGDGAATNRSSPVTVMGLP